MAGARRHAPATALWRTEQALAPERRGDVDRLLFARLRLEQIAADTDHDGDPVLDAIEMCAYVLADSLDADADSNYRRAHLGLAAAELLAIVLLARAPGHAGWLGRASARLPHGPSRARPT